MSEPTVVWSIEQCAKIQNHLVWEALEFWNSASLSILAQNIDCHHLKKKGFSFLTHCNSVREIQHSKNTSECLTVKTPSLLQLCFKIVSIFFFLSNCHHDQKEDTSDCIHHLLLLLMFFLADMCVQLIWCITLYLLRHAHFSLCVRTNMLTVIGFDGAKKTQKYHQVDRAFKLSGAAIHPNDKFIWP